MRRKGRKKERREKKKRKKEKKKKKKKLSMNIVSMSGLSSGIDFTVVLSLGLL